MTLNVTTVALKSENKIRLRLSNYSMIAHACFFSVSHKIVQTRRSSETLEILSAEHSEIAMATFWESIKKILAEDLEMRRIFTKMVPRILTEERK